MKNYKKFICLFFLIIIFSSIFGDDYQILYQEYKKRKFLPYIHLYLNSREIKKDQIRIRMNPLNLYYYGLYPDLKNSKGILSYFLKNNFTSKTHIFSYEFYFWYFYIVEPTEFQFHQLQFDFQKEKKEIEQQIRMQIQDSLQSYRTIIFSKESILSDFYVISNFEIVTKNHYKYLAYLLHKEDSQKQIQKFYEATLTDLIALNLWSEPYIIEINRSLLKDFYESYQNIRNNPTISKRYRKRIEYVLQCLSGLPVSSYSYISFYFFSGFFRDYGRRIQKSENEMIRDMQNSFEEIWFYKEWMEKRLIYLETSCKKLKNRFR